MHCGLYRRCSYRRAVHSPSITPPLSRLAQSFSHQLFVIPYPGHYGHGCPDPLRSPVLSQSPLPCPELPITDSQGHYCDLVFHRVQIPEYRFLLTPFTPIPLFFFFRQNNSLHRFVGWILREGMIFFALWRNRSVIWKMVRWRHLLTQARTAARISGSLKVGGTGCGPNPPGGPYWKSGRKKEYLEYVWWPASGHVR